MKLILASSGFDAPESIKKCVELVGKPREKINFAIINEAYAVEHDDHRWILDDMDGIRNNFGGNIEFVNLLALSMDKVEERINHADVIFVVGGNTKYLKSIFDKTGFSKLLPKILKSKVLVGSSAGASVVGHIPDYKLRETDSFGANEYLGLIDSCVLPHLHSKYFTERSDDWAIKESEKVSCPVYALSDHSALVIDGDKEYVIGHDYLRLVNGKTE